MTSTTGVANGLPTSAYHSKSISGHTVQAEAGTAALANAMVAKPAEMSRCIFMRTPPWLGTQYREGPRGKASGMRFLESVGADTGEGKIKREGGYPFPGRSAKRRTSHSPQVSR